MRPLGKVCCGLIVGLLVVVVGTPNAWGLGAGDLAIVSFASDDPDAFAFVALQEIPAGTVIRFTDSGWLSSGGFRANEGGVQYTVSATLTPGTVISRSDPFDSGGWAVNNSGVGSGGFLLSTSGDQILVFTGDAGSPNFVNAICFDSTGFGNATSSNTTALPAGLTEGASAVAIPEADNGYYSGPTSGTASALLSAIGDSGNWTTSDSPITPPAWSFSLMGGVPAVQAVTLPGSAFDVDEVVSVTVTLSAAPQAGSPATIALTSGAFAGSSAVVISHPSVSGTTSVSMANPGVWTVDATATANATGGASSVSFSVGSVVVPPTAYAGEDRNVILSSSTVAVALDDATGDTAIGLAGATYAWTPATGSGIVGWQNRSGDLNATTAPGNAVVTLSAAGVYTLTLTVTDDDGLTDSDTVAITVNNPVVGDQYDPPAGYYAAATGQGATLKTQLAQIITNGHDQQTYDDYKTSAARYDADPNISGHILLVYDRQSVPGGWDGGSTWNREHVWPQSRQPGSVSGGSRGNLGDPHALRPADPTINSTRGNKPFGLYDSIGANGSAGEYYFPGDTDKGDIARSQFYSATRYMDTLTLVSGYPSGNEMGDLDALIRWHYTDVPDTFERRRNHLIYQDQHNRSPFVDRPELAWSVFGDGTNDSTLYVSATEPADGASTLIIDFPTIIVGGPLPALSSVTLHKAGTDPTYYAVSALGDATCSVGGRYNAFDFGVGQRGMTVGISGSTFFAGVIHGSVIIDNLDVSSAGAGQGAADGDDVIDLTLTVLDHAEASFAADSDLDALTISFGALPRSAAAQATTFAVYNLASASGYTAALDVMSVASSGDGDLLPSDVAALNSLSAGAAAAFQVSFDPAVASPGAYSATYTLSVADEDLPGKASGTPLVLTVTGTVSPAIFPFDDDGDTDVDAADAVNFVACVSGPAGGPISAACTNHDADGDGDIDLQDVAALQLSFTGE